MDVEVSELGEEDRCSLWSKDESKCLWIAAEKRKYFQAFSEASISDLHSTLRSQQKFSVNKTHKAITHYLYISHTHKFWPTFSIPFPKRTKRNMDTSYKVREIIRYTHKFPECFFYFLIFIYSSFQSFLNFYTYYSPSLQRLFCAVE